MSDDTQDPIPYVEDEPAAAPQHPWFTDIYLFTLWAFLAAVAIVLGAKELGNNLASGWAGALAMYLRGRST